MGNKIDLASSSLGIELGSTRIKAVLLSKEGKSIGTGSFSWKTIQENGYWTYPYSLIEEGLASCYADLKKDVLEKHGIIINKVGLIGISAMMHGYLPLDNLGHPLVPFRTWMNTNAASSAKYLTQLFNFPIPTRWSIAHLHKAINNKEPHIEKIAYLTTLAGCIHYKLTGEKVLGIGDASGMFPIDSKTKDFDEEKIALFEKDIGGLIHLRDILPSILLAGQPAGELTKEGALLLDTEGDLEFGIPFVPPEGDAGTGMVATNAIAKNSGNVSAGTSIFSMVVLDKPLKQVYPCVDIVTTPLGDEVAMVHCNNCSMELDRIVSVLGEQMGLEKDDAYERLFKLSLEGELDAGGLVACNYVSDEEVTRVEGGNVFIINQNNKPYTNDNLMKAELYSCFVSLKIGMDNFIKQEDIHISKLMAHGGLFKIEGVADRYLSAALNCPIEVSKTAGEGGAYGMALLAGFPLNSKGDLQAYLDRLLSSSNNSIYMANEEEIKGFETYTERFIKAITPYQKENNHA